MKMFYIACKITLPSFKNAEKSIGTYRGDDNLLNGAIWGFR